jgi:hypothetical protein
MTRGALAGLALRDALLRRAPQGEGLKSRHASSPRGLVRLQGAPVVCLLSRPFSPEGACGTPGVSPRPRRHVLRNAVDAHGTLCLERNKAQGSRMPVAGHTAAARLRTATTEAGRRLRSARDGFCGLLHVPGGVAGADAGPVRASCRPDMHLGRPPVTPASILFRRPGPASLRPPPPAPRQRRRSRRAPYRNGMDEGYF